MCGIAGIIGASCRETALTFVDACGRELSRRGPDGEGLWQDADAVLLHRRLAVVDVANGIQPMANEDGTLILVANGEIYNYRELRDELRARGHSFATASDSEVILHGYEAYGDGIFARLDGMFALALYDLRKRELVLARDGFGKKPLFYWQHGRELVFASTLNALKCHPEFPRTDLRTEGVRDFLSYWYVPGDATIFRGVNSVPRGSLLHYDGTAHTLKTERYFTLHYGAKEAVSLPEAAREVRRLLERAVDKRLMSEVPLGAFLSGGLDSYLVAALMLRSGVRDLNLYTIGFADRQYDEREAAAASCRALRDLGLDSFQTHELVVDAGDFDFLKRMLREVGQPYADASILPTGMLCRFARESLTVALSGDGADELFGGYERYQAMRWFKPLDRGMPPNLRRGVCSLLSRLTPAGSERTRRGKLKRLLGLGAHEPLDRYFHLMNKAPWPEKCRIAGERLSVTEDHAADYLLGVLAAASSPEADEIYAEADVASYLAHDLLVKADTASMSCGLEVRSPFLDRDLAVYAARLPFEFKLCGHSRKELLKQACRDLLPEEVANRRKKGFGVPVARFLAGPWRSALEGALLEGRLLTDGWITRSGAEALLRRKDRHAVDLQWSLLCLEIFLENEFV